MLSYDQLLFWRKVYIAAIKGGRSSLGARDAADKAIEYQSEVLKPNAKT